MLHVQYHDALATHDPSDVCCALSAQSVWAPCEGAVHFVCTSQLFYKALHDLWWEKRFLSKVQPNMQANQVNNNNN